MRKTALSAFKALSRVAISLLILGIAAVGMVLSFTTPIGKIAEKPNGARLVVVGTVSDQPPDENVANLNEVRGENNAYVIGRRSWPNEAFVVVYGEKQQTETGRPVIMEERSWWIPVRWAPVTWLSGVIDRVPVPAAEARWVAGALALMFVLLVARFTLRAVALGFVAFVGLIAGSTLANAAVDFNLINNSLLACATLAASVIAVTLGAARLLQ